MSMIEELREHLLVEAQSGIFNGTQPAVLFDEEVLKANEEEIRKIERDMGYKL